MRTAINPSVRLLALCAGLFLLAPLGGCETPRSADRGPAFAADAADEVFSVGFSNIAARYIEPVSLDVLILDGLRGFATIDPSLSVAQENGVITMRAERLTVAAKSAPAADDAAAWSRLITDFVAAARTHSPEMQASGAEKIYEAVFDGVLSRLDVYSRYAGAEEATRNRARRDGYGGIGVQFLIVGNHVQLTDVHPDEPAGRAGLERNDRVTHINDLPVAGLDHAEITRQLRGPVRSRVTLTVLREGASSPLRFTLERIHIVPRTVTASVQAGVLVLKVANFNHETGNAIEAQVNKTRKNLGARFRGIVLDLRGSPGGLLRQSTRIADLFLAQGRIVSAHGRHPDSMQTHDASGKDIAEGRPIVVLIDGKSASAAEIVAAALQDRGRAVVVGTPTYGKGTVQTVIRLPNDGEITLTWSQLVAPSGYVFHGLGVTPTLCTSGLSGGGEGNVARVMAGREKSAATLADWRRPEPHDEAKRRKLKAACPPEADKLSAIDLAVARKLIQDDPLYRRTVEQASGLSQAQR